jgi:hypothetical protein
VLNLPFICLFIVLVLGCLGELKSALLVSSNLAPVWVPLQHGFYLSVCLGELNFGCTVSSNLHPLPLQHGCRFDWLVLFLLSSWSHIRAHLFSLSWIN